jgi:hypothetical protein
LIKFNLFTQAFLLFVSVINALFFYFARGDENLSVALYALMFLAQMFIIVSCIWDIAFNKKINKYMAWSIVIIYGIAVLFFGSETDAFLYKALLLLSLLMLALYVRSKLIRK